MTYTDWGTLVKETLQKPDRMLFIFPLMVRSRAQSSGPEHAGGRRGCVGVRRVSVGLVWCGGESGVVLVGLL